MCYLLSCVVFVAACERVRLVKMTFKTRKCLIVRLCKIIGFFIITQFENKIEASTSVKSVDYPIHFNFIRKINLIGWYWTLSPFYKFFDNQNAIIFHSNG